MKIISSYVEVFSIVLYKHLGEQLIQWNISWFCSFSDYNPEWFYFLSFYFYLNWFFPSVYHLISFREVSSTISNTFYSNNIKRDIFKQVHILNCLWQFISITTNLNYQMISNVIFKKRVLSKSFHWWTKIDNSTKLTNDITLSCWFSYHLKYIKNRRINCIFQTRWVLS